MKKNYILWVTFIVTTITFGQTIFINEIHYDNLGAVIQFLSYEGVITAINGDAIEYSLQLTDNGWEMPMTAIPNLPNTNQTTLSVVKNQIEGFLLFPNPVF